MSDFLDDLESELRSAAHRRAATRRIPGATRLHAPALWRPRPAGVLAAVIAAVVIAAALVVLPIRDETKPAAQPPRLSPAGSLAILNGTTTPGLATKARQQIRKRLPHRLIPAEGIRIGNAVDQHQERSTVLFLEGRAASARRIAEQLGISSVRLASREDLAGHQAGASASIVVLIGRDLLKP